MSTEAKPISRVNYFILNVNQFHRLHYVWFQNNPGQVNKIQTVKIYGVLYPHKFYAVEIFLEYHPSSNNITRCQVPLCVGAWFHDSADDIDFYQMSLSQSE